MNNELPPNDDAPQDAVVTPFRPVGRTGERTTYGGALPSAAPTDAPLDFEVCVIGPDDTVTVLQYTGFMVATSVFVGFADEQGLLQGIVPMDRLLYVAPADAVEDDLVVAP